jgi:hypothetical protein
MEDARARQGQEKQGCLNLEFEGATVGGNEGGGGATSTDEAQGKITAIQFGDIRYMPR